MQTFFKDVINTKFLKEILNSRDEDRFQRLCFKFTNYFSQREEFKRFELVNGFRTYTQGWSAKYTNLKKEMKEILSEFEASFDDSVLSTIVEKAERKIANTLFLLNKYPEKLMYYEPWCACDDLVMQHLETNNIKVNKDQANILKKERIKLRLPLKNESGQRLNAEMVQGFMKKILDPQFFQAIDNSTIILVKESERVLEEIDTNFKDGLSAVVIRDGLINIMADSG